jgi:hypothetical protein
VILEGFNGRAYFIPMLKQPEIKDGGGAGNQRKKAALKEGEIISIKTYESQTGRLTPTMYKKSDWAVRREIREKNYSGSLAQSVTMGKEKMKEQGYER